ncbi:hypothetical protein [Acetobacter cibinongensis]|uniref:hypothetical protein n=1 Tax=Acetobacter cibinongensis TaxID=146475 RepID=UPI00105619FF|nr:hypothetical protein [Acetobacter cibinongensis]
MKNRKKRSMFRRRPVGPFKKRSGGRCDPRAEDFHKIHFQMMGAIERLTSALLPLARNFRSFSV